MGIDFQTTYSNDGLDPDLDQQAYQYSYPSVRHRTICTLMTEELLRCQ